MDVAMEDDVFFADLNRQISLLITEEDDEVDSDLAAVAHYPSLMSLQANWLPAILLQQQQQNDHHQRRQMLPHQTLLYSPHDCRREIRGTGVFIPRSSSSTASSQPPRRKGKQQGGSNRRTSSSASAKQQFVGSSTRSVAAAYTAAATNHSSYNYNVNRF